MTHKQSQTEWRRRACLEGESKTRNEAVDASRGALTIYAPGFKPPGNSLLERRPALLRAPEAPAEEVAEWM
jgi:hypothetical protein